MKDTFQKIFRKIDQMSIIKIIVISIAILGSFAATCFLVTEIYPLLALGALLAGWFLIFELPDVRERQQKLEEQKIMARQQCLADWRFLYEQVAELLFPVLQIFDRELGGIAIHIAHSLLVQNWFAKKDGTIIFRYFLKTNTSASLSDADLTLVIGSYLKNHYSNVGYPVIYFWGIHRVSGGFYLYVSIQMAPPEMPQQNMSNIQHDRLDKDF